MSNPTVVFGLGAELRAHLSGPVHGGTADEIEKTIAGLRRAIERLDRHQRTFAKVDFNLDPDHSYPTLTARQESLAQAHACAGKTVRRRANRALEALAFIVVTDRGLASGEPTEDASSDALDASASQPLWPTTLRSFWRLGPNPRVDIVCSEIPEEERPYFASPTDRNYLRYAKFADLDSLIFVRTRLAQLGRDIHVRDFAPSEYHDTDTDTLVVIGGPPWNAKYREFLPQLPFHFKPHPLGEDDPLVVPQLDGLTIGPRWTEHNDLLEDLAVFTRLTLSQGPTVFLLGGCLTLGVLGAARCFLDQDQGTQNARFITDLVGDADFVVVTEARRVGGIADVANLDTVDPLLVLASENHKPFSLVIDNSGRYLKD